MSSWSAKLPFTEESVRQHVRDFGGVYRLICKKGEGCLVFYVGSAAHLETTLLDLAHGVAQSPRLAEYLHNTGVEFRFFPTDDAFERSRVEDVELAKWHPCCNGR